LEAICLKAMAKTADDRYPTMENFAAALRGYLDAAPPSRIELVPPVAPPIRPRDALDARSPSRIEPVSPVASPRPQFEERDDLITNTIGMRLKLIPAGSFVMGSDKGDSDEKPPHRVEITRPFYLGIHQVTQSQYRAVTGNPSHFKGSDDLPVEQVSWFDAIEFCNRLSEREKLWPCYKVAGETVTRENGDGYFLPTEAQWEYACRAGPGGTGVYCFGDDATKLGQYAWYQDNSGGKTHSVGQKFPNSWGLYDLHGNVWEWCWDGFEANYYRNSPSADPSGPSLAPDRVIRGGGWGLETRYVRSAVRCGYATVYRSSGLGFRAARVRSGL
jgi:formylglycine-generating enzyme required for sulfatase activity